MAPTFSDLLHSGKFILFDGGMGTQLAARGAQPGAAATLETPEIVLAIHRDYRDAGAQVLITNTFSANRPALSRGGKADQLTRIIAEACRLARQAAGKDGYVAGDVGPTGEFLEPYGTMTEAEMRAAFAETVRHLLQAGVDLLLVETMTDGREASLAIETCRALGKGIPVVASMSFDPARDGFRTSSGLAVTEAAKAMTNAGAHAVGANCGTVTPDQMAEVVGLFRKAVTCPIIAQANAGLPELRGDQAVFRLSPEAFASGMVRTARAGAQLLGGCCGTTPAHIRALCKALRE